ncbi:major tail protein [Enterococcus gallinarum]|uniref:major tail protein n=1 Tax=Enterococcus gallinarum TaxID=1353 RepID=UPI0032E40778
MGKTDVLYFEGLEDILIAMMSPEAQDGVNKAPEYGGIVRLPIATKLAVKGNGTTLEKWASSKMFRRVSRETKHELGLDHVGIPIDVMDELKGLIAESGVTFSKNTAREFPFFAFGFIGKIEGGGRKAVWYPKTQLSNVIDEEYATEEDETKIDDVTANLVSTGLNYNNVMYSSFDSNRTTGSLALFEKFIAQPIYSEQQWQTIAAATPPVGGGE